MGGGDDGRAALLLALSAPAVAADHPLKGVALVIGEDDYAALQKLDNPKRDARAMDDMLDSLGFTVDRVLDGDRPKLWRRSSDSSAEAKGADVALIYYSGHGIEAGGRDYPGAHRCGPDDAANGGGEPAAAERRARPRWPRPCR